MMANGGEILAECLGALGCDRVFGVPGESFLGFLDALVDRTGPQFVTCRHEGGAAFAAVADARLTGRLGVCFVTRGPGACNAAIGVHTAEQDRLPLMLLVGLNARGVIGRQAFQEFDLGTTFSGLAKFAATVDSADRIAEWVHRAARIACDGRRGPVVLGFPEDVLSQPVDHAESLASAGMPEGDVPLPALLGAASSPFILVGGGTWSPELAERVRQFAEPRSIPVGTAFRCQDYIDNRSTSYVGDIGFGLRPELAAAIRAADPLLVLGDALDEPTTGGYTLLREPAPRVLYCAPDAHTHPYLPASAMRLRVDVAGAVRGLAAFRDLRAESTRLMQLRERYLASLESFGSAPQWGKCVRWLSEALPTESLVINGSGDFAAAVRKHFQFKGHGTQLAPRSGAMGYAVPAGLAAGLRVPGRMIVTVSGDGCFLMNHNELATAQRYQTRLVHLVVDNACFGTIRSHQERNHPGRPIACDLVNPDFCALGAAFGLTCVLVDSAEDFPEAFARVSAAPGGGLIHLRLDR
jgi:acetolactate synthase-1/2/3 large subunit